MEAQLREKETWTFEDCEKFAAEFAANDITTRSVISKVKNLGLQYQPKPAAVKSTVKQIRKSDMVRGIAKSLEMNYDAIAGLAKADKRALTLLQDAIFWRTNEDVD
jgi:hypothetical protein